MSYLEAGNRGPEKLDESWNDICVDDLFDRRIPLLRKEFAKLRCGRELIVDVVGIDCLH